jgi:restriction system protein
VLPSRRSQDTAAKKAAAMTIPNYEAFMLPLLRQLQDGNERHYRDVWAGAIKELGISEADQRIMLPSGSHPVADNRCGWARTYLKKAGMLESTRRGFLRLTDRGRQVLAKKPTTLNSKFLEQFPEFVAFKQQSRASDAVATEGTTGNDSTSTPEEALDDAYARVRRTIEMDLLDKVRAASPDFFERLVVELLVAMGYGGSRADAGQAIGKAGDEGIDGIIKEDRLGLDAIYLQAKRWNGTIGRPELQKFAGALQGRRARKGVFITTSDFSQEARDYVQQIDSKIALIDGRTLASLMFEHNVGVARTQTFELKQVDGDYFEDASPL